MDHFIVVLESFWGRFGVIFGVILGHFGVVFGSFLGRFGTVFGLFWIISLVGVCFEPICSLFMAYLEPARSVFGACL